MSRDSESKDRMVYTTVSGRRWSRAFVSLSLLAAVGQTVDPNGTSFLPAFLLFVGDPRRTEDIDSLVSWLLGGAVIGGGIGYAAIAFAPVPLSTHVGLGLGVALGGGLGVVSNLLADDARDVRDSETDSVTVEMESDEAHSPRPADLFDGHPDPILYVGSGGDVPIVRAANDAFARTFDVPEDAFNGTPLAEALLVSGDPSSVTDAVVAGERLDTIVTCQTAGGESSFRVRTIGTDVDGYVIYTPMG